MLQVPRGQYLICTLCFTGTWGTVPDVYPLFYRYLGDSSEEAAEKPRLSLPEINVISEDNQLTILIPTRRKASLPTDSSTFLQANHTATVSRPLTVISEQLPRVSVPTGHVEQASLQLPKSHTVT